VSIANNLENKILDAVFNGVDLPGQGTVYVKLHTGDPGEDCTGNAASETTRKAATFGAASVGAVTSDADITWTNVAATETYSHISIWDAVNAGNPLWYGALTASKAVTAGDTFTIPSASLTASLD
jgi:hypothetical protein